MEKNGKDGADPRPCEFCEADVEIVPMVKGVEEVRIIHDDDCPFLAERRRMGEQLGISEEELFEKIREHFRDSET
jgi:hypothetical protein